MIHYPPRLKQSARQLRSAMTNSEQHLWARLRRRQLCGIQFFRQRPVGRFIVDFYAPTARLIIEVDGSQHLDAEARFRDKHRDRILHHQGFRVMRFDNLQVLQETDAVIEVIRRAVEESGVKQLLR